MHVHVSRTATRTRPYRTTVNTGRTAARSQPRTIDVGKTTIYTRRTTIDSENDGPFRENDDRYCVDTLLLLGECSTLWASGSSVLFGTPPLANPGYALIISQWEIRAATCLSNTTAERGLQQSQLHNIYHVYYSAVYSACRFIVREGYS